MFIFTAWLYCCCPDCDPERKAGYQGTDDDYDCHSGGGSALSGGGGGFLCGGNSGSTG